MEMNKFVRSFTSEAVSEGHPDKVADQISDAILDLYLTHDSESRVACETLVTEGVIILAGEITSKADIGKEERELAARKVVYDLGYDAFGFDPFRVEVIDRIHEQSPDINQCVTKDVVAGDQGIIFGYASNESPDYLPLAFSIARKILRNLTDLRHPCLGPDSKCMVTILEFEGKKPVVANVLVSTQHTEGTSQEDLESIVAPVIKDTIKSYKEYLTLSELEDYRIQINPSGRFVLGGPAADTGLTGRKIVVDSYGGACPHGGGAYSGKDPSKVDRSAAYYARYMAKSVVASGLCDKVLVSLSYTIGEDKPTSVMFDTLGTNKTGLSDAELTMALVPEFFDPRTQVFVPSLRIPIFKTTAKYGHFGHEPKKIKYFDGSGKYQEVTTFPWEQPKLIDKTTIYSRQ